MNKDPFSKLQSSLPLEDLLNQPSLRNSHNWLLTYLDVFVLIVMLVITLITLGDLKTEQQAAANKPQALKPKKAPSAICPPAVEPVVINCPSFVSFENKPVQQIAPFEPIAEIEADKPDIKTESKQNNIAATAISTDIQQAAANIAYENKLQQQLTKTIDEFGLNDVVTIKVTHGYAQLEIQDKVLFKSSEADLTASGEILIKRLTPLLKQAVGLILIEGHTDNIPIKTAQFPSNWELGASRATSVLHFLVAQQLDSSRLRAISYADTMPIADNSTAEGREKNRRVNILIKFSEQ